jgi:alkylhydroperoxidase/carboxymuconolactone decarboxylase family protein YurZ
MYLPEIFQSFKTQFPEILNAHQEVGDLCSKAGPMDEKTRHLIQLGIAVGTASRGAVRSHARRALAVGATREEVLQVVLLSTTVIGFPSMIASFQWVEEVLAAAE